MVFEPITMRFHPVDFVEQIVRDNVDNVDLVLRDAQGRVLVLHVARGFGANLLQRCQAHDRGADNAVP